MRREPRLPQLQSLNGIKMKGNNKSKQNKLYNKYSFIVKHQKQTLGGGMGEPRFPRSSSVSNKTR